MQLVMRAASLQLAKQLYTELAAPAQDESLVVSLIQRHLKYTKSAVARAILNNWQSAKQDFVKVFPHEYARALQEQSETKVVLPGTLEQLLCALCDGPQQCCDAQHGRVVL